MAAMMNARMNKMIALALAWFAAIPGHAETLAGALEHAWERHPQAAAMTAREAEARARAEVAAGITPGPGKVSLGNVSDQLNGNAGKQEWELEMAVPLWLPGQRAAREAEAELALGEVAARRAALRLQVMGELREAWWNLAAARAVLELSRHRAATARDLEQDVLRRFRAGDLARIDANLARGEYLTAETEALESENAMLQAEQALAALTGRAAPASLAPEEAAAPGGPAENHPRFASAAVSARLARARVKVAEETRRDAPELSVRLFRERGDASVPYGNAVGVKLEVPLSSGARVRQEQSAAQAEAIQGEAELALLRQRLALEMERARADLDLAQRRLVMARERRELAADSLRLAEKSFSLGESDLPSLLRVRAAAFAAEAQLGSARIAREAAVSRLNQAQGVMP